MAALTHIHDLSNENARDLSGFSNDLKDSYMDQAFNTVNFGWSSTMDVGRGAGKAADEYRIIALYDLQNAIPASGVITAAFWHLHINSSTLTVGPLYQWQIDRCTRNDWHELWVCWDKYKELTAWTTPGGDYAAPNVSGALILGGASGWQAFNILTLVQDARNNRGDILNMIFRRTDDLADAGVVRFRTKQSQTPPGPDSTVYAPHVRITYTLDGRTFQVMLR